MRKLVFIFIGVIACFAWGRESYAFIDRNMATLRIMNKAAGKTQMIDLTVDNPVKFEKLNITLRACKQNDPFDAENFYAFVEIQKNDGAIIFSNWMNRNNPGKNPVQNPDYDVWLVKCDQGAAQ